MTKKFYIFLTALAILLVPAFAFAAEVKPINLGQEQPFSSDANGVPKNSEAQSICTGLFKFDPTNMLQGQVCTLINLVDYTVVNFALAKTCEIQSMSYSSNFKEKSTFNTNGTSGTGSSPGFGSGGGTTSSISQCTSTTINGTDKFSSESALTAKFRNPNGTDNPLYTAFKLIRGLMAVAAIVALFYFAFANILHYEVNTYAIKKALPQILIAILGGWFAYTIVFVLSRFVDVTYGLSVFSPNNLLHPMQSIFGGYFPASTANADSSVTLIFKLGGKVFGTESQGFIEGIFGVLMLGIPGLVAMLFEYVLALRPFVVGILAAVSPLAFACLVFPQTQAIFRRWATTLSIALLFTPVASLFFYLINRFPTDLSGSSLEAIAIILFKTTVIAFLVRLPFAFESDAKGVAAKLDSSGWGSRLGLNRISSAISGKQLAPTQQITLKSTPSTQTIIAKSAPQISKVPIEQKVPRPEAGRPMAEANISVSPILAQAAAPQAVQILESAHKTNLERPANVMVNSVADIPPEVFRAVATQSDTKIWKNPQIVQTLKTQNGQILDERGAATRADSIRKTVRLAQVEENGKLQHPEAVKILAQKGALATLPAGVLKKTLEEKILTPADFSPTFEDNTQKVISEISKVSAQDSASSLISENHARGLMSQDQADFSTGFQDLRNLFKEVVEDKKIMPPPPPAVVKNVIHEMRRSDSQAFEKNNGYYLKRLSQGSRQAQAKIANTLSRSGVVQQTATAIANNPRVDFSQALKYVPQKNLSAGNLRELRDSYINRDLSRALTGEFSQILSQQKISLGNGIAQKLADGFKLDKNLTFDKVQQNLRGLIEQMSRPLSPDQIARISKEVDKYHPMPIVKTGQFDKGDLEQTKTHAAEALKTTEELANSGVSRDDLISNPARAKQIIQDTVAREIAEEESDKNAPENIETLEREDLEKQGLQLPQPAQKSGLETDNKFEQKLGQITKA